MKYGLWIFLLFILSGCGGDLTVTALRKNSEATQALKAETPDLAVMALSEGLAASPFLPELHTNLGIAFDQQKKGEDAIKSLKSAEAVAQDPRNRFIARYNLGVLYGKAKQVDEALAWYQKALEIHPTSKEVKINIELLTQSQQGGGEGEQQQQQDQEGQGQQQNQDSKGDQKDQEKKEDPSEGEGKENEKPKEYGQPPPQYKPREFKGELHESDVKKILGEIKQQEQKIRTEYNRRDVKERPRQKDW